MSELFCKAQKTMLGRENPLQGFKSAQTNQQDGRGLKEAVAYGYNLKTEREK